MQWLSDERAARVTLTGTSAGVFDGIDPARTGRDSLPYVSAVPRIVNERTTNWTAGPCPNPGWAERVHPELEPEAALDKLWEEVTYVLRLDTDDPVAAWRERMKVIVASADRMTERRFDSLHLKGDGTDLTIGLMPSSKWLGADFSTADGITHYPNLPTEEVFTTPDPGAGRRPRLGDDAARALRLVHERDPDRVRGRTRRQGRRRRGRGSAPGRPLRKTTVPHGSARSPSSTRKAGSGRFALSSTRRCWTRTPPATSRSETPTRSRSRTRPTASA